MSSALALACLANPPELGVETDLNGNCLANLLDFAFGLDPTAPGSGGELVFGIGGFERRGIPILASLAPRSDIFLRRNDFSWLA